MSEHIEVRISEKGEMCQVTIFNEDEILAVDYLDQDDAYLSQTYFSHLGYGVTVEPVK